MGYIAEAVGNHDGKAGDGGGREVRVCEWWDYTTLSHETAKVYRHPDTAYRNSLMRSAVAICRNDAIGYMMNEEARVTSYRSFDSVGWDISRIPECSGEIDCSEMMACCVNFAKGYMPSDTWTGNIGQRLITNGFAELPWDTELEPGDIMVVHDWTNGTGHTGMHIGGSADGEYYDEEEDMKLNWFRISSNGAQYLYADGIFQHINDPEDLNVLMHIYAEMMGGNDIPNIDADDHWVEVASRYFPASTSANEVTVTGVDRAEIEAAMRNVLANGSIKFS